MHQLKSDSQETKHIYVYSTALCHSDKTRAKLQESSRRYLLFL